MLAVSIALVAPFTVHGGRLAAARAVCPEVPAWTDLSTGIAPFSYPVQLEPGSFSALPDPVALSHLEALAAQAFGTAADRVTAVPGSDLALRLLGATLPGDEAGWTRLAQALIPSRAE